MKMSEDTGFMEGTGSVVLYMQNLASSGWKRSPEVKPRELGRTPSASGPYYRERRLIRPDARGGTDPWSF